jgi:hypothetical protein
MADPGNTLLLEVLQDLRKELQDHRSVLSQSVAYGWKLEHLVESRFGAVDQSLAAIKARFGAVDQRLLGIDECISGLKDDLELMIKSELLGALGNFETRIEHLPEQRLAQKT